MDKGTLFLVATPIGNLGDITKRAVEVLAQADFVAAEDTRHTVKLLNNLGLKKTMLSFHEHSGKEKYEKLYSLLSEGKNIALVSDAGTPLISDPGSELVKSAAEQGFAIVPVPGACAPICALIASGLPVERFTFEGFLPREGALRKKMLKALAAEERTSIILESPFRLKNTIAEFMACFGEERKAAICRELTKIYEEILRGTLRELKEILERREIKGEIVIVLAGVKKEEAIVTDEKIVDTLKYFLADGCTKKDAVIKTAQLLSLNKNKVYKLLTIIND